MKRLKVRVYKVINIKLFAIIRIIILKNSFNLFVIINNISI